MKILAFAFSVLLMAVPHSKAQDMSWAEANRASVEALQAGELEKAASLAETATDLYGAQENYNPDNYFKLAVNEADILLAMDKAEQAALSVRDALYHVEETRGRTEPVTLLLIEQMADLYLLERDIDEMKSAYDRYIARAEEIYGPRNLQVANAIIRAVNRTKQFEPRDETLRMFEWAENIAGDYPSTDPTVIFVLSEKAKFRMEVDRFSDAEDEYEEVLQLVRRAREDGNPIPWELESAILTQIAHLYEETNRDEAVAAQLEEIIRRAPDSDQPQAIFRPNVTNIHEEPLFSDIYTAVIELDIDADGRPHNPRIVEESGWPLFDRRALEVSEEWRFVPPKQNGETMPYEGFRITLSRVYGQRTPSRSRISR